jgi:hypothetical protein
MNFIDGPRADSQAHDEVMIIDWVNSLDIPSCTLADDIHDLKSGCVVADIIPWLFNISLPYIQRDISCRSDAVDNWRAILEALSPYTPKNSLVGLRSF